MARMWTPSILVLLLVFVAHAEEWILGESLDDDDESPPPAVTSVSDDDDPGPDVHPDEVTFGDGSEHTLSDDIVFDMNGNVEAGGSTYPDINMWHLVEFNGKRMSDPTEAADRLKEAIEGKLSYVVKFAPPTLAGFKCTEKVEKLEVVFEREFHDQSEEFVQGALATLAAEGIVNTRQLWELYEEDIGPIKIPAIIKSRLRKIKAEVTPQFEAAERAARGIDINGAEVANELREFMEARKSSRREATNREGKEGVKHEEKVAEPPTNVDGPSEGTDAVEEEEEEDGTFKSLVWAIMNCPTCKGKDTVQCFRTCRYGGALDEEKKQNTWQECLNKCISNRWLRATFSVMLPKDKPKEEETI